MKKTVRDVELKGKKVLCRCDFNVPMKDGEITDDFRIVSSLPTVKYLIEQGARVILMSHMGKPKGEPKPELSLGPVALRLTELLGQEVKFISCPTVISDGVREMAEGLSDGEVMLLENTRYRAEETKSEEPFTGELASLGELFVNDAFGTAHRDHSSTAGIARYLPTVSGFLIEKVFKNYAVLFPYALCAMIISFLMLLNVKHGDSKPEAQKDKLEALAPAGDD